MARRRDYAAEYAARQARSQERYGVSYSQQRRLVEQGRTAGQRPEATRQVLAQTRDASRARQLIEAKAERRAAHQAGRDVRAMEDILDFDWAQYDLDDEVLYYH
jgi:hypothetical protein